MYSDLGLDDGKDTFKYLSRYALFKNPTQGLLYLSNIPGYLFKVTPKIPQDSALFPYLLLIIP